MTVSDFLTKLGSEILYIYEIHWNMDDVEVYITSEFEEAIIELFGNLKLLEEDCIYFSSKENSSKPILQIYIEPPIGG